jgi:hypothetical protein
LSSKVLNFSPFGLGCSSMIVSGLAPSTGLMRRSHIGEIIVTTKFERADVLSDPALAPALARTVNFSTAHHTPASCCLPHL